MGFKIADYMKNNYFRFRVEGEGLTYTIPQTVVDGSDIIQFQSNWTKQNLPGSTEPMVAFNYVDAPSININLRFHEDMWREADMDPSGYLNVINKFASLIYPSEQGQIIKPPYCLVYINGYIYRGYFTSIRINQSGNLRREYKKSSQNSDSSKESTKYYKTTCEISSSFVIIKRTAPIQSGIAGGFRTYFGEDSTIASDTITDIIKPGVGGSSGGGGGDWINEVK